jgi:four helix bundle protein
MGLAYKEARETSYWLRLFTDAKIIDEKMSLSFLSDTEELNKILASILHTTKGIN